MEKHSQKACQMVRAMAAFPELTGLNPSTFVAVLQLDVTLVPGIWISSFDLLGHQTHTQAGKIPIHMKYNSINTFLTSKEVFSLLKGTFLLLEEKRGVGK